MRVGIFYISRDLDPEKYGYQVINLPGGGKVWIRVEEVEVASEEEALNKADLNPRCEALMNTHRLPDPTAREGE